MTWRCRSYREKHSKLFKNEPSSSSGNSKIRSDFGVMLKHFITKRVAHNKMKGTSAKKMLPIYSFQESGYSFDVFLEDGVYTHRVVGEPPKIPQAPTLELLFERDFASAGPVRTNQARKHFGSEAVDDLT